MVTKTAKDPERRRREGQTHPLFLSVAEVATSLNLGITYTRRLIDRGDIKSVRVGKRVLVPQQYLDEYVTALLRSAR